MTIFVTCKAVAFCYICKTTRSRVHQTGGHRCGVDQFSAVTLPFFVRKCVHCCQCLLAVFLAAECPVHRTRHT